MRVLKKKSALASFPLLLLLLNARLDFHYDNRSESTINSSVRLDWRNCGSEIFLIARARTAKGEREIALVREIPFFPLPLERSRFSCSPPVQNTRSRFRPASGAKENVCVIFPDEGNNMKDDKNLFFFHSLKYDELI